MYNKNPVCEWCKQPYNTKEEVLMKFEFVRDGVIYKGKCCVKHWKER